MRHGRSPIVAGGFALSAAAAILAFALPADAWTGQDATPIYQGADTPSGGPTSLFSTLSPGSGWTCGVTAGDDSASANLFPATFQFPYYGTTQTTGHMGTNGYLTFGTTSTVYTTFGITNLPTAGTPNNVVYGVWEDLNVPAGSSTNRVCHKTTGSGTSEVFHAMWENINHLSGSAPVNFVIMLYEQNGIIEVHYGTSNTDGDSSPEIAGIESSAGSLGIAYSINTATAPSNVAVQYRPVGLFPAATADTYTLNCNNVVPCTPLVVNGLGGTANHRLTLAGPAGAPAADTTYGSIALKAVRMTGPLAGTLETVTAGACSGTAWATGAAASTDGSFCYRPAATGNPCGTYTFQYRADDGFPDATGASPVDVGTVTLNVINCQPPPVPANDPCASCAGGLNAYEAAYGHVLVVTPEQGLLVNDLNPVNVPVSNAGLTADCTSLCVLPPGDGTVAVLPDGSFAYTPPEGPGACRPISFQYRAVNLLGVPSNSPATVSISLCPNLPPDAISASVAPNPVEVGQEATFTGLVSDPEGRPVRSVWSFGDGRAGEAPSPVHVYENAGVYNVQLTAVDFWGDTDTVSTTVTVIYRPEPDAEEAPLPITVQAGSDRDVSVGERVRLHASSPDGRSATFQWTQVAGTTVQLLGADTADPSLVALGEDNEELVFEVVAREEGRVSEPDEVVLTLHRLNHAPTIVAHYVDALPGQRVVLDASASYDVDHDAITATWAQASGVAMSLEDPHAFVARGIVPLAAEGGSIVWVLNVTDGETTAQKPVVIRVAQGLGRGEPIVTRMEGAMLVAQSRIGGSTYTWSFGDGASGSGADVRHAYAASGNYTVALSILGLDGATRTYSTWVLANITTPLAGALDAVTEPKSSPGPAVPVALGVLALASLARRTRGEPA